MIEGRTLVAQQPRQGALSRAGSPRRRSSTTWRASRPVAIPHLTGRALTFRRYPGRHRHERVLREALPRPPTRRGSTSPSAQATARVASSTAGSTRPRRWCGPPTWRRSSCTRRWRCADALDVPRALVFDFDPGAPAAIAECCKVARRVAGGARLRWGSRVGARRRARRACRCTCRSTRPSATHDGAADFALAVGQVLERQLPGEVTTVMAKAERPGKIFVDWSQNAFHKTTIAPYSLRARPEPTVSTPVTWDEVERCAPAASVELRFTSDEVLDAGRRAR